VILARRSLWRHPVVSGGAGEARTRTGAGSRWAVSDESEALACRPWQPPSLDRCRRNLSTCMRHWSAPIT